MQPAIQAAEYAERIPQTGVRVDLIAQQATSFAVVRNDIPVSLDNSRRLKRILLPSNSEMLGGAFHLMFFWNTDDSLSTPQVQELTSALVERMSQEKDTGTFFSLGNGLTKLKERMDPATTQKLASMLVESLSQEHDDDALGSSAEDLRALEKKIDSTTAQRLATRLVERINQERSEDAPPLKSPCNQHGGDRADNQ